MKVTRDQMLEAIINSNTVMEAILALGMDDREGRSYRYNVKKYGLQAEHESLKQRSYSHRKKLTLEATFSINGCSFNHVRARILEHNLIPFKCAILDCPTRIDNLWLGNPVTIQLDHINGNNCDNRLENLRFLCLNCHGQTETYGANNYKYRNHVTKKVRYCSKCNLQMVGRGKYTTCRSCFDLENKTTFKPRKLKITEEEFTNLILDHSYKQLAAMFNVSVSTIAGRAKKLGIDVHKLREQNGQCV